jgi:hypothetical protein
VITSRRRKGVEARSVTQDPAETCRHVGDIHATAQPRTAALETDFRGRRNARGTVRRPYGPWRRLNIGTSGLVPRRHKSPCLSRHRRAVAHGLVLTARRPEGRQRRRCPGEGRAASTDSRPRPRHSRPSPRAVRSVRPAPPQARPRQPTTRAASHPFSPEARPASGSPPTGRHRTSGQKELQQCRTTSAPAGPLRLTNPIDPIAESPVTGASRQLPPSPWPRSSSRSSPPLALSLPARIKHHGR